MIQSHPRAPKCSDSPDLWFSDREADKREAKAICLTCPLLAECREYGKTQEHGIWGGIEATPNDTPSPTAAQLDRAQRNHNINALAREGYSHSEIAIRMSISKRTVDRVRAAHQNAA